MIYGFFLLDLVQYSSRRCFQRVCWRVKTKQEWFSWFKLELMTAGLEWNLLKSSADLPRCRYCQIFLEVSYLQQGSVSPWRRSRAPETALVRVFSSFATSCGNNKNLVISAKNNSAGRWLKCSVFSKLHIHHLGWYCEAFLSHGHSHPRCKPSKENRDRWIVKY